MKETLITSVKVLQIFFLSYQKSRSNLTRKGTIKFKSILRSVAGAMQGIPAVLAGGASSVWQVLCCDRLCTPSSACCAPGLPPRGPCTLGICLARTEGQDAPEKEFHGLRSTAAPLGRVREGGTAQNPQSGSPRWEVGEGGRLPRAEEQDDFPLSLLNSKTWNTKSTVDLSFYRSLWSRLWNKSSCGAPRGMLYTEFINKVSPFFPLVLVRCWKCGCLYAQEYAGAKWHAQIHVTYCNWAYITYFHCILNLGPVSYYLHSYLVSQRILLIAFLFFFSFLWKEIFLHRNSGIRVQPSETYVRNSEKISESFDTSPCHLFFSLFHPFWRHWSIQACVI